MAWFNKKKKVLEYTANNKVADNYLTMAVNASRRLFGQSGGSFGISPSGKRDYNEIFGYGVDLAYCDYKGMFKRGGIAYIVVAKIPKSCWRDVPKLKSGDSEINGDDIVELKKAGLFKALERADIANRIGDYSAMLIGIPDGMDLDQPIGSAAKGDFQGLYFRVFEEDGITVAQWDNDPASSRYGKPLVYTLQCMNAGKLGNRMSSIQAHYSRVVHFSEGALANELEGTSSLEAPWNAVIDKEKVRGSAAESYFRNSRQKLALEADKDYKLSGTTDELKTNVENFQNGFEDTLRLQNMKANMLQPSVSTPRDAFDIAIEEIAGTTGIPIRILTTKAGGTTTGSEDKATWNALVNDRQDHECTPWLCSALDSLVECGMMSLPDNYDIEWAPQSSLNEIEASQVTKNKADAFEAVSKGLSEVGGDEILAESVFAEIGLDDIEVNNIDLSSDDEEINESLGDK